MDAHLPTVSNEDRSSHVIGSAVILIILPTVAVILRLLSRYMSKAGFWVKSHPVHVFKYKASALILFQIDDYTVILSLVRAPSIQL